MESFRACITNVPESLHEDGSLDSWMTPKRCVISDKNRSEWLLTLLQEEDKTATSERIFLGHRPTTSSFLGSSLDVLKKIFKRKIAAGQWVAIGFGKECNQAMLARMKKVEIGVIFSSLDSFLEPKKLIEIEPCPTTEFKKESKTEDGQEGLTQEVHLVDDSFPTHLRERILAYRHWAQRPDEPYDLSQVVEYYDVPTHALDCLDHMQKLIEKTLETETQKQPQDVSPQTIIVLHNLKKEMETLVGPLGFPVDPVQDESRYHIEQSS